MPAPDTPAVITSAVGVVISATAAAVTWLNYKILAARPTVVVRATFNRNAPVVNVLVVELNLENHTTSTWVDMHFEVSRPRGVKSWCHSNARIKGSVIPYEFDTLADAYKASKSKLTDLGGRLLPAGSVGAIPLGTQITSRPTDQIWRDVWLDTSFLQSGKPLSMRVTLLSSDAKPRKHVIAIKRTVPDRITAPTS